jgi:hypothetical protein
MHSQHAPDTSIFLFACVLSKRDKNPTPARHFYSIFPARAQSIPHLSLADPSTDQTHPRVPRFGYCPRNRHRRKVAGKPLGLPGGPGAKRTLKFGSGSVLNPKRIRGLQAQRCHRNDGKKMTAPTHVEVSDSLVFLSGILGFFEILRICRFFCGCKSKYGKKARNDYEA